MVEKNGQEIGLSDEFKPRLQNLLALALVNLRNIRIQSLYLYNKMVTHFFLFNTIHTFVEEILFVHLFCARHSIGT